MENDLTKAQFDSHQVCDHTRITPEIEFHVDSIIKQYPVPRSAVLMILHTLQEKFGYLTPQLIEWTASKVGVDPIHVLELVTFYPMLRQTPSGQIHIKICKSLPCMLKGSLHLYHTLCAQLNLDPNNPGPQTTPDGHITVEQVECLAACDLAPVAMLSDQLLERCTISTLEEIIRNCNRAEIPK